MKNERQGWDLDEGVAFVRELQKAIEPSGYHAGLLGSVLHKGSSKKDLDVVVFPIRIGSTNRDHLLILLNSFAMELRFGRESVTKVWREAGSQDTKHVEVWDWYSPDRKIRKRIDLFFME